MFYFLQKIQLKGQSRVLIFVKENDTTLTFKCEGEMVEFEKSEFLKSNVVELWETVKLFGRKPIKRLARAF
jgi:hypothetical protein